VADNFPGGAPIVSEKDEKGELFKDAEVFA
jgi:hypothetical protein